MQLSMAKKTLLRRSLNEGISMHELKLGARDLHDNDGLKRGPMRDGNQGGTRQVWTGWTGLNGRYKFMLHFSKSYFRMSEKKKVVQNSPSARLCTKSKSWSHFVQAELAWTFCSRHRNFVMSDMADSQPTEKFFGMSTICTLRSNLSLVPCKFFCPRQCLAQNGFCNQQCLVQRLYKLFSPHV